MYVGVEFLNIKYRGSFGGFFFLVFFGGWGWGGSSAMWGLCPY